MLILHRRLESPLKIDLTWLLPDAYSNQIDSSVTIQLWESKFDLNLKKCIPIDILVINH